MVVRVPLGSQVTSPCRRAFFAAFLLEFPVHGCATVAVLGYLPRRHLWISGTVVKGSAVVETAIARTRRDAAHVEELLLGNVC